MDILGTALSVLIILIVTHIAVFWVVRTLYPPVSVSSSPEPVVMQTFTQPPSQQQEPIHHVTIPTYEAPVSLEAPSQERGAVFTDISGSTIQRDTGLAPPNTR